MSDPAHLSLSGARTLSTPRRRGVWERYGFAAAVTLLAIPLTFALARLMGEAHPRIPFALFFAAVVLASWYGGRGPGLLATALSAFINAFLFLPPTFSFALGFEGFLQLAIFLLVSLLISSLLEQSGRAGEAAYRSNESLMTTLRSIGDAVIATDARGHVTFMNPVAETLTGWTKDEARSRELHEVFRIVNEDTRAEVESPVAKVLREGKIVGLANHTVLLAKDGSELPIDDSGAPVRDEAGNIVGVVLVFHDISERRRAESEIRRRERELSDFVENASVGLHWVGGDGTILWANRAELEMLGYSREEYVGHSITEFHADAHIIEDILGRLTRNETLNNYEARLRCKDGSIRHGSINSNVMWENGEFVHTRCFTRDITAHKQAAEARSQLAAIVESSDDAIIGKTLDGIVVSWNKGAERIYGYAPEEMVGRSISVIIPAEYHDQLTDILTKLRAGERIEHLETVRVRKDGTRINSSLTISPIANAAGAIVGASTIARDITAQERTEVLVRESEERYRYLADSMPQIVWTARPDGYFDYYNERWFEYTGMTLEQTEGWGWQPVLHPEDAESCLRKWAMALTTGEGYDIEYRFKRASDGAYRWHLGRAVPMRDADGNIVKWFGTATDIHDRKRAEESLRFMAEASELLASSLDYETTLERLARLCVSDLADYCLIDVTANDGQIRRVAAAHRNPDKEELAQALRNYPPDADRSEGVPKVLRTGKAEVVPRVNDEKLKTIARADEHARLLRELGLKSYMTLPLRTRSRTVGALTFGITETGRAYTPADLSFAQELARRAALAVDNARLYSRAQEANKAKDEFLATLSHELRTPLTPIIGWLQMIRDQRISDDDARHGLQIVEKNAQSLAHLINDLLDMSSILSGKMSIERAPVEVAAVLREAAETVRQQADSRGVPLVVEACHGGDAGATVSGDRTRLVQVFWNILNNAVKFSDEGQSVRVRCEARDGAVRVNVSDEGRGIESAFLPHVFERFRQADGSTTRVYGGLGIGLALVKSFVEAHGGTVSVESPGPGQGSSFAVTLPLLVTPASAPAIETPLEEVESCAEEVCRVLVVEDARDTLDMLQVIFESRGFHTTLCSTADEALRVAQTASFDIIVSDIGLPQTDGYELIRLLHELPHLRDVPAVALTGYAAPKDAASALAAGFDAHIPKPVDPTALLNEIEKLLQLKGQAEESKP